MDDFKFTLIREDSGTRARVGCLETPHGRIETPVFMPVGTVATVKSVRAEDLHHQVKARIVLANTYHLYLRPGPEILEKAGGIHRFMNWKAPVLTDSGGYQVYSLAEKRTITEEGVHFQSHIDGSKHFFTPEKVIDIQRSIGADIIMAFDECPPYPCTESYARQSVERTHRWLERCWDRLVGTRPLYGHPQALFPIAQGAVYPELREASARFVAALNAVGYAIGGLAVGEPEDTMYAMLDIVTDILPRQKPRYLMGVGTPSNILEAVARGVDMMDCVMPTRNARHGMLFTWEGMLQIKNARWQACFEPLNPDLFGEDGYTFAYLHHLFRAGELLAFQLATLHNLHFYISLMQKIREKIAEGTFSTWYPEIKKRLERRRN
ncbi:MAG: tRNA guanosine(34) transglycosylase Tgt [Flavobacteriales bacterium]|nr:tRNA guanosine(34) transglycosylase Tgt [Flavobacteriales bacterium]